MRLETSSFRDKCIESTDVFGHTGIWPGKKSVVPIPYSSVAEPGQRQIHILPACRHARHARKNTSQNYDRGDHR